MHEIKNYMEICVTDMLDSVLKEINGCKCENCKYDIIAITLNSLPSKYVVTKRGQFYTKLQALQQQFDVDIISAITKAAVLVAKNPRHEESEN
jgi:competence protein ComFB